MGDKITSNLKGLKSRKEIILAVVEDLKSLRDSSKFSEHRYAIKENMRFFNAIVSPISYIWWLLWRAPKLRKEELLELSDFSFASWERDLHLNLIAMERKKFPGLITPLKNEIVKFILEKKPGVVMDLGAGGMEIERQIIEELALRAYPHRIIFIGIDRSKVAEELARENLSTAALHAKIYEITRLNAETLKEFRHEKQEKHIVIFCKNDIFNLGKEFSENTADIIFYSKFRHHLNESQKILLDKITHKISRVVMEYDDYRSLFFFIPQSLSAWSSPVLLNGAIFSRLRDPTRQELKKRDASRLKFFPVGSYLLTKIKNDYLTNY